MNLDWKVCNCAGCGQLLLGESMVTVVNSGRIQTTLAVVAGRVNDRPVCPDCYARVVRSYGLSVPAVAGLPH